jgi:hypothetical protein
MMPDHVALLRLRQKQRAEELIRAARRITIYSVATAQGCCRALAYSIMQGRLKFRKVSARWVPRELKELKDRGEKTKRIGLSLQNLLRYADEGEDVLNRIVIGDETWFHHYQPQSKCTSMQWK